MYGDHGPCSLSLVDTIYLGKKASAMMESIETYHFAGGNIKQSALHEGIGAVLHVSGHDRVS